MRGRTLWGTYEQGILPKLDDSAELGFNGLVRMSRWSLKSVYCLWEILDRGPHAFKGG